MAHDVLEFQNADYADLKTRDNDKDGRFGDCLRGGFLRPPRRGVPNHEPEPLGEFEGAGALIQYTNRVYLLGNKGERQWSEYTGTPSSTGLPARKSHMRGRTRLGADSEMARTTRRSGFRSVLFLTGGSPS